MHLSLPVGLVLLLLIHCFMHLPFLWEFCVCSLFCCALLSVLSSFAIILKRKRELVALLKLSSKCCEMMFCDVMGLSAVCDCGIS